MADNLPPVPSLWVKGDEVRFVTHIDALEGFATLVYGCRHAVAMRWVMFEWNEFNWRSWSADAEMVWPKEQRDE